jgi:hypothetical protein
VSTSEESHVDVDDEGVGLSHAIGAQHLQDVGLTRPSPSIQDLVPEVRNLRQHPGLNVGLLEHLGVRLTLRARGDVADGARQPRVVNQRL